MWTLRGNPSAQWHASGTAPPGLRHARASTELQSTRMASEFLLVSMAFVSPCLTVSRRREMSELDRSRGTEGCRRRPASRSFSCRLCQRWYSCPSLNSDGFSWRRSSSGRIIVSALLPVCRPRP